MSIITTLRIVRYDPQQVDGEYFCEPGDEKQLQRAKKDVEEAEPGCGLHLETRGTVAGWHDLEG